MFSKASMWTRHPGTSWCSTAARSFFMVAKLVVWFMSFGVNELDTWIENLHDKRFWIDYCKKIDQPSSNKLSNIFDLAALVYVKPEKKVQVNKYEWTGEELIIDGHKQNPSFRACLSEKQFKTLNKYAYKTYAPATDESRLSGAGAGLSDND